MARIAGERKKGNFAISISRSTNSHGPNMVSISIEDRTSGIEFFDGDMTLEDFGSLVTGLSMRPIQAEVRGLQFIGKKQVHEPRKVVLPSSLGGYRSRNEEVAPWIAANCQEEGWMLDLYLGSRDSIVYNHTTKEYTAHYSVYKYVDAEVLKPEKETENG